MSIDELGEDQENDLEEQDAIKNNTKEKLNTLKEIILDNEYFQEINKIKTDKKFDDPEKKENLAKLIEKWDYTWALNEWLRLILSLFSWDQGSWYQKFEETGKSINRSKMDNDNLVAHIKKLEEEIWTTNGITRKLHITKMLSDAKDTISIKKNPQDSNDKYNLLADNIKPGQILLLNDRSDNSSGANLLRSYEENNPIDFTHTVLVSENKNGEIMITHSTMKKESSEWAWVEQIPLREYIQKHKPIDILALDQSEEMKQNCMKFAREQIGKWYDYKAALSTGLWKNWKLLWNVSENEKFNCVELVAQAYKNNEQVKKLTHPNDWLDHKIFTPSYMTEII